MSCEIYPMTLLDSYFNRRVQLTKEEVQNIEKKLTSGRYFIMKNLSKLCTLISVATLINFFIHLILTSTFSFPLILACFMSTMTNYLLENPEKIRRLLVEIIQEISASFSTKSFTYAGAQSNYMTLKDLQPKSDVTISFNFPGSNEYQPLTPKEKFDKVKELYQNLSRIEKFLLGSLAPSNFSSERGHRLGSK